MLSKLSYLAYGTLCHRLSILHLYLIPIIGLETLEDRAAHYSIDPLQNNSISHPKIES